MSVLYDDFEISRWVFNQVDIRDWIAVNDKKGASVLNNPDLLTLYDNPQPGAEGVRFAVQHADIGEGDRRGCIR